MAFIIARRNYCLFYRLSYCPVLSSFNLWRILAIPYHQSNMQEELLGSPFSSINPMLISKMLSFFVIKFFVSSSVIGALGLSGYAIDYFHLSSLWHHGYISKSIFQLLCISSSNNNIT